MLTGGLPSPGEGREGHPSPGFSRREVPGINHCAPLRASLGGGVSDCRNWGEKRIRNMMLGGGYGCLVSPAGIFQQHRGPVVAASSVPGWPCPGGRSHGGGWRRQRPAWRQGGRLHCSRPVSLCAGVGARLSLCLAGLALRGHGGHEGDKGCCVVLAVLSSRCPGCRRQPRRFPALALPFLKIVFIFLGRKSLRLLSGVWAGLWHRAAVPGLGDARVAPGRGYHRVLLVAARQGVKAPCCPKHGMFSI